ncbi:MAG: hypothetical protein ACFFCG_03690 [Promethearchaeota archaeon]
MFTNRLYEVSIIDTLPQITQFFFYVEPFFNLVHATIIIISITLIFLLKVKKALISGIIGFCFYMICDINDMFISNRVFILRIFVLFLYFGIQMFLIYLILKPNEKEIENIKKIVIDMSDKFTLTSVKEISEKTESDHDLVMHIVNTMITDGDINADLFRRSKTIAFYKQNKAF